MGKIKRLLDEENQSDFITDKELDESYEEWKNSEQYAEMINNQFELHKSKYSDRFTKFCNKLNFSPFSIDKNCFG